MYSQSLPAQLLRFFSVLVLSLVLLHQFEEVIQLMAKHAIDFGCHQTSDMDNSAHHHSLPSGQSDTKQPHSAQRAHAHH